MLKRVVQSVLVSALMLSGAGCGYIFGDDGIFRDRSEDYKAASELPPITVPPGMKSVPLREIYVIPPVEDKFLSKGEFEVPKPAPLSAGAGSDVVRIQKLGDASWALIGIAPGQVWPQVRNFMSASGMQVARADAQAALQAALQRQAEQLVDGRGREPDQSLPVSHRTGRAARYQRAACTADEPDRW